MNAKGNFSHSKIPSEQLQQIIQIQSYWLEQALRSKYAAEVLLGLCAEVESLTGNLWASVTAYDADDQSLDICCAPNLSTTAVLALNKQQPGQGSCGTAVVEERSVLVSDIRLDQRWQFLGDDVHEIGICACWSAPVFGANGIIGTFALSCEQTREPSDFELLLLQTCTQIVGVILDRDRKDQYLLDQAHKDALTGLPNRMHLEHALRQRLMQAHALESELALLFIDLDMFKQVNDSFGHGVGDKLLTDVAIRLNDRCVDNDLLARIGGDEFVLIAVADSFSEAQLKQITNRFFEALDRPFNIDNRSFSISASIGLSIYPKDAKNAEDLLQCADTAMFAAKKSGRNRHARFNRGFANQIRQATELEHQIRTGLDNREFMPFWQPQVDSRSGKTVGVEILARWNHPERGLVNAGEFIQIAENTGLTPKMGALIAKQALWEFAAMLSSSHGVKPDFPLALNVTASELGRGFTQLLEQQMELLEIPNQLLEIEITEHSLMLDSEICMQSLNHMHSMGIALTLDDFGVGHSSLAQLNQLPVSKIKIDKSFVHDLRQPDNEKMIDAIVSMARNLELEVIAEGVETEEQVQRLMASDCALHQGYYLARPMDTRSFRNYLVQQHFRVIH